MIEVTKDTWACFIERNEQIKEWDKLTISYWLKAVAKKNCIEPQTYATYIKQEVVSALSAIDRIKEVVQISQHIWCQTYFIGPSAELFYSLLLWAKENNIRDKVLLDLAPRMEAKGSLLLYNADALELMLTLERNNNIAFIFGDEILKMIKSI